jgi:hypothetical protein
MSKVDIAPLLLAVQQLDETLKRGVVIGIYEDSMEVSDEDIIVALKQVKAAMIDLSETLEKLTRRIITLQ